MKHGRALIGAILWAACSRGSTDHQSNVHDTGGDDTSIPGDTAQDTASNPITLTFDIDGDATGATLGLLATTMTSGQPPTFGGTFASAPVDGTQVEVQVTNPAADELQELDGEIYPGWMVGLYLPILFDDANGDGAYDDGTETITGAGTVWVLYSTGEVPDDLASVGVEDGWNSIEFPSEDGAPVTYPTDAIPISVNLVPVESVTLGGTYDGSTPESELRLAVIPAGPPSTDGTVATLYDQTFETPWSVTIDEPPPDDLLSTTEDSAVESAVVMPVGYIDEDGSGSFTSDDQPVAFACDGTALAMMLYQSPPTSLAAALELVLSGAAPGWSAVASSEGAPPEPLDTSTATSLSLSEACAPPAPG